MSVRHALLALLAEGPQHGLHLKQGFEKRTGELWPLNVGQVYSTLRRLERDGLVVAGVEGSDARQSLYEMTESGHAELERWLYDTPRDPKPPRDELVIRVLVAITIPGVDPISVIDRHRRQHVEIMQQLTKLKMHDESLGLALVADAELFRLEGAVRWLDLAEARLARGERLEAHEASASTESEGDSPPVTSVVQW